MIRFMFLGAAMLAMTLLPAGTASAADIGPNPWTTDSLGVGTASPAQTIHLFKAGSGSVRFRLENADTVSDFFAGGGGAGVITQGVTALTIDGNQNVYMTKGFLGVGTNSPQQNIHLFKAGSGTTRFRVENSDGATDFFAGASGSGGIIVGGLTRMLITSAGNIGIGTGSPSTKLDVAGEVKCTVLQITGGADLSERFGIKASANEAGSKVEPGTIVCIDMENPGELIVSAKAYDRTVAGIVSGAGGLQPGMTMGQSSTIAHGEYPVALTGRVYCKVDTSSAAIVPGDLLTTSPVPGHAMKVSDYAKAQGAIIGKAMTPLAQGQTGLVLVLVSLQ